MYTTSLFCTSAPYTFRHTVSTNESPRVADPCHLGKLGELEQICEVWVVHAFTEPKMIHQHGRVWVVCAQRPHVLQVIGGAAASSETRGEFKLKNEQFSLSLSLRFGNFCETRWALSFKCRGSGVHYTNTVSLHLLRPL